MNQFILSHLGKPSSAVVAGLLRSGGDRWMGRLDDVRDPRRGNRVLSEISVKANLVGSYTVFGTEVDGSFSSSHTLDISMAPSGALELDWDNGKQVGVGQVIGDVLAVACLTKGRTVILTMKINPDGSLSGKWSRRTDRGTQGTEISNKLALVLTRVLLLFPPRSGDPFLIASSRGTQRGSQHRPWTPRPCAHLNGRCQTAAQLVRFDAGLKRCTNGVHLSPRQGDHHRFGLPPRRKIFPLMPKVSVRGPGRVWILAARR